MDSIYLDCNATMPIRPEVLELVGQVMQETGNTSSVHHFGRRARAHTEQAREAVANLTGVRPQQVAFNSGATEANNTVLSAFRESPVLISAIEHPSVFKNAPQARMIPVTKDGVVDLEAFEKILKEGKPPALVSVMLVNSETGVVQPVKEIAALVRETGALVHTDAVQAAGRIALDFEDLGVDFMSLSAHKMGGPQGVGCLVIREGADLPSFMCGGGHEQGRRAGTLNTAGIAGFGLAAKLAQQNLGTWEKIEKLRDHLEKELQKTAPEAVIYGQNVPRVGNTSNIGLPGVPAQTQLMALDLEGIAVSSGSACSSGAFKPSHVLTAMGADEDAAKSALRISLGWATTADEIERFIEAWSNIYQRTA
ncbi:MAG: cysteine desulfurase [Rhodospirillales bacterium]|nr:cysteine desulfurase [Alphaproteobacteria bacterium]USO04351.1 MAG: cysteine desulfurase [Rhodospirillales bacterium]